MSTKDFFVTALTSQCTSYKFTDTDASTLFDKNVTYFLTDL